MKLKHYFLMALVAISTIACSKNEDNIAGGENSNNGTLELTLKGVSKKTDRAVGLPATVKTSVSDLTVLFADTSGEILSVELLSADDNVDMWNTLMGIGGNGQMTPVTFEDLPDDVTQVHIFGNIKTKVGVPAHNVGSNVSIFSTTMFDIANMNDISSAILFGKDIELTSTIEPDSGHTLWSAELTIAPTVARFEIGNIQCNNLTGTISNFKVKAIGLDNIFENISFDGSSTTAPETVKELEIVGNNGEALGSPLPVWAYDNITPITVNSTAIHNPATADNALEVGGNGKYVYHFVPQRQHVGNSTNGVGADLVNSFGVSPKIRLELSDVTANNGTHKPNKRWVTAIFNGENSPKIFEAGKIYQINLNFKEDNIEVPDPSQTNCVELSVTVADWVIEPAFTPDFE